MCLRNFDDYLYRVGMIGNQNQFQQCTWAVEPYCKQIEQTDVYFSIYQRMNSSYPG
jgi:hypothetical protein